MTESSSLNDQHLATEEVGLTDCVAKEPKLEPEEDITYQSLSKSKPNPKSRGKRKRQNNWDTTKHPNNCKSTNNPQTSQTKHQKAVKDTQNDTSEPKAEQQINAQVLTEDEYIIAYIKEEVEEEIEINSDQIAFLSTLPQIKDEPESSEPSTIPCDKVSPPSPPSPKISDSLIYNQTQVSTITAPNSMPNSPKPAPKPVVKPVNPPVAPKNVKEMQICPHCAAQYYSMQTLKHHFTQKHPSADITAAIKICPECSGTYTAPTLQRHLTTMHNPIKQYVCRHCEASFGEEANFLKHLSSKYTGENPLCCAACRLFCSTAQEKTAHLLSPAHTRPPFKCTACGVIVPSRRALGVSCEKHQLPQSSIPKLLKSTFAWKNEPTEVAVDKLRLSAGPSLDSLAAKLGLTPSLPGSTKEPVVVGDDDTDV